MNESRPPPEFDDWGAIPDPPRVERPRRMQFTLRRVWLLVTLLCLVLAVPGIAMVGVYVSVWFVTGLAIVLAIALLQLPAYLILRTIVPRDNEDRP